MFLDDALTFSDNQGPIVAAVASTSAIPLGPTGSQGSSTFLGAGAVGGLNAMDVAKGEPVSVFARLTQAFNNLTSLDIDIQACDDQAGANPVSMLKKNFLAAALAAANKELQLGFLGPIPVSKKWLRAYYTPNGAAPTTGKISCGLVPGANGKPQNDVMAF